VAPGAEMPPPPKRFVTGGCDKLVKIWTLDSASNAWRSVDLVGHSDWVRDVAWAPNIGLPTNCIASCSQDKSVFMWTQETPSSNWEKRELHRFPAVVWRLSWSVTGNILAISSGDNTVSLWKESHDGQWRELQKLGPQ